MSGKVKIDVRNILSHHVDFAHIPAAESTFMGQADELDRERVEAHHFSGDCVNCNHISAGQDVVLDQRNHAAGAWPVARKGAIHDREDARMNFLLNGQQINQRLVNHAVCPMPFIEEQATERVLHGSSHLCKHVRLHGRQMDDIGAHQPLWNADALGKDFVQGQHLRLWHVVNPLLTLLVQMNVAQAVFRENLFVLVCDLALVRVHHDSPVVAAV